MNSEEVLHPGRKSIRIAGGDYSRPGNYFVTICATEMQCVFGLVKDGQVILSKLGNLVHECWSEIPKHFPVVKLHCCVVMPNHLHGMIRLEKQVKMRQKTSMYSPNRKIKPGSLPVIVRSFKSAVSLRAKKELGWHGDVWQRNYWERVIRDGKEFADVTRYIAENPVRWEWKREKQEKSNLR